MTKTNSNKNANNKKIRVSLCLVADNNISICSLSKSRNKNIDNKTNHTTESRERRRRRDERRRRKQAESADIGRVAGQRERLRRGVWRQLVLGRRSSCASSFRIYLRCFFVVVDTFMFFAFTLQRNRCFWLLDAILGVVCNGISVRFNIFCSLPPAAIHPVVPPPPTQPHSTPPFFFGLFVCLCAIDVQLTLSCNHIRLFNLCFSGDTVEANVYERRRVGKSVC